MFRSLENNQLSGTITSSIGNLAQLLYLYVHCCFQFRQPSQIKLTPSTQTSLFFAWLCSEIFPWINWLERSLHRSVILPNLLCCMFILAFNSTSKPTSKLTLSSLCMFRYLYNNSLLGVIPQALCQNSFFFQIEIFPNNGVFTCPLPTCCVSPSSCSLQGYSASCSNDTKTSSESTSSLFCCYYDSTSQPAVSICSSSSCPPPREGYSFYSSALTSSCSRCST